ncbi:peptide ABC transporter substrate-binding protein, partial [Oleibacter sp. HI0075]
SIGLTGEITLEAFYQLEWDHTRSDPCGTFFSTVDFVADGCGPVILGGTADERDILALRDLEIDTGVPLANRVAPVTERIEDEEPSDSGQYGMAVRWYSEALGDTEFGFYYMNIHSRLPYINGVITNQDRLGVLTGTPNMEVNADATYNTYRPLYQMAYPEDIKIAGVSFARSTASGASISGEISYKPDMPVQWNAFELILAGNGAPWSRLYQQRAEEAGNAADLYGEVGKGYDEFDIWQAQSTYIMFFDRVLGADRLALVGEVGATYIPDLPDTDDARYGRSGAYGIGNNDGVYEPGGDTNYCIFGGTSANVNSDYCTDDGYTTKLSGGIRLRSGLTYNNAFAGVNMTPNLSIAYDKGYGPEPGSQFIDDRLTVGLGVSFLYLNQTSVDVSYTNFSGGKYNQLKDRDNISLSAKYSF